MHFQVLVENHRHEGIFISRGKEDALVTKNMVPGDSVYGEKRVSVEVCPCCCEQPSPNDVLYYILCDSREPCLA